MLIPWFKSVPEKYVEKKRKKVEITSVDYKVGVMVRFKERITYKEYSVEEDGIIKLMCEKVREPAESYKFGLMVKLSAYEYKENAFSYGSNRDKEEEYVINKAKDTYEFKRNMNDLLANMPADREYEVEVFVLREEVDGKKVNKEVIAEWTEYVAEY